VRWFAEGNRVERYDEAVASLRERRPGVSGLGKWIWDAKRLIDYIETMPGVDKDRIGMIGHSLGGKMTLYAAAMDPRIRAAVSSEPGLAFKFSNYGDYWYYGERLALLPEGTDQHELLGMIAPRPFLLIGGEDSDGDKSWPYLEAARGLFPPGGLGWINHRAGHTPTADAISKAMDWLRSKLEEPVKAPSKP
jgi:pimeloyl-ACP methyl ester carboxylesterase